MSPKWANWSSKWLFCNWIRLINAARRFFLWSFCLYYFQSIWPILVAEEDFLGQNHSANDICQHFFLTTPHHQHQHSMLSANFCQQFPANNPQLFPHQISTSQGGTQISQLNQQPTIQQQPHQQRLSSHGTGGTIHLWHFIRELLEQPKEYGGCVRWVDRKEGRGKKWSKIWEFLGTFKIESSHHLARYWGIRKNRSAMNYDKLSRSLRQYYKKGIIQKPEKKQRLVCSKWHS